MDRRITRASALTTPMPLSGQEEQKRKKEYEISDEKDECNDCDEEVDYVRDT